MDLEEVPKGCQVSHRKLWLFSAVLHDTVWAVSTDANAEAACGSVQTEEELSLFFLIRDSNASEKSRTG